MGTTGRWNQIDTCDDDAVYHFAERAVAKIEELQNDLDSATRSYRKASVERTEYVEPAEMIPMFISTTVDELHAQLAEWGISHPCYLVRQIAVGEGMWVRRYVIEVVDHG